MAWGEIEGFWFRETLAAKDEQIREQKAFSDFSEEVLFELEEPVGSWLTQKMITVEVLQVPDYWCNSSLTLFSSMIVSSSTFLKCIGLGVKLCILSTYGAF